jgi:hypothetical protein
VCNSVFLHLSEFGYQSNISTMCINLFLHLNINFYQRHYFVFMFSNKNIWKKEVILIALSVCGRTVVSMTHRRAFFACKLFHSQPYKHFDFHLTSFFLSFASCCMYTITMFKFSPSAQQLTTVVQNHMTVNIIKR